MTRLKRALLVAFAAGLLLFVLAIAGFAVLQSDAFHRYLRAKVDQEASRIIGGRVETGNLQIQWSGLRVILDEVVLHGSEGAAQSPLLHIRRLSVGVKIVSLWRRKFGLYEVVVDDPAINLRVDKAGHSNLPQPKQPAPSAPKSASTSLFELAVDRFALTHGELDYNDRRVPIEVELRGLQVQVAFDPTKTEYDGAVEYRAGRIHLGSFNPMETGLKVNFGATPAGAIFHSLAVDTGSSRLSFEGELHDYGNPSVDGNYQASVSTVELARIVKEPSIPSGQVQTQGALHYRTRPGRGVLENLAASGRVQSSLLALNLEPVRADFRNVAGEYQLAGGTLVARKVTANVLGGTVVGAVSLAHLSARPIGRVTGTASGISLQAAEAFLNDQTIGRTDMVGTLNGTAEASWTGDGQDFQVSTDATIAGSAPVQPVAGSHVQHVPLNGVVHASYEASTGTIRVRDTQLATSHLTIKLDGDTGKRSSLGIHAHADDLREVDAVVMLVRRAMAGPRQAPPPSTEPLELGGSASFEGQLHGAVTDLHLTGLLTGTHVQYRGATLNEVKMKVAADPTSATVTQGELRVGASGDAHFEGGVALRDWAFEPPNPIHLGFTAALMPVVPLMQLARLHYPIDGTLGANVALHGTVSNLTGHGSATLMHATVWNQPIENLSLHFENTNVVIHGAESRATGQGSLTVTHATAWGQPIENLGLQWESAGSSMQAGLQASTSAGSASGKLTYNFESHTYDAQLSLPAVQLDQLVALRGRNAQVSGVANASLTGHGILHDPQLMADIAVPALQFDRQPINGFSLHVDVARHLAKFTLSSATEGASIQARGEVELKGNYPSHATLDVGSIQLGTVVSTFLPQAPQELHGQAELHGSLRGPLKQPRQFEAEFGVPTLNLSYRAVAIGNASPIHALYRNGVLSVERCELKGTGTDLQVQATIPFENPQGLAAAVNGQADLRLVQLLYPEYQVGGQLRLDLNAHGSFSHPGISGAVSLNNVSAETPNEPLGVQNVNATLAVNNDRIDIRNLNGESGGGTFSVQGFAAYQPALQFDLALTAQRVRLRYPVGTRAILDGKLGLTGNGSSALLSGQLLIDSLGFTRQFDIATFADQFSGNAAAPGGPSFAQDVNLNVSLRSATEMALASSQLSVQGSVNLTVRGTLADPVVLGRTSITGGEIFFNGNRYVVQSGVVEFANPLQTEPVVNMVVTTTIEQFNLTLNFIGPLDRMRTTYSSDPPLAPVDIINLLATGQTTEAASNTSTSPESVVAGQLTNQLSNRVQKLAGITSLTIDPQIGGAQGSGVGRLAVQQRVTKNLFFTFSTDLTTSTGTIVQVEYQITQRFAVNSIRDQNGGYTLEIRVHKRF